MAERVITHQPRVSSGAQFQRYPVGIGSLFEGGHRWGYTRGRDALFWGYRCLRAGPWRVAWFPSFHCGVEVQAAVDAGFEARFYRLGPDLGPDLPYLEERLLRHPGPVTVIHYFGHISRGLKGLAALCSQVGVPLVEDACHGPLGSEEGLYNLEYGAIAAFSLRKVLGTPDGGALRLSREKVKALLGGQDPVVPSPRGRAIRPVVEYLMGRFGHRATAEEGGRDLLGSEEKMGSEDAKRAHRRGISLFSASLVKCVDPTWVFQKRRQNWSTLSTLTNGASGLDLVFPNLREGDVPLSFAIRVERRDEFVGELLRRGIDCYIFGKYPHWALPRGRFPEAQELTRSVLGLPIHQSLEESEIERMAEFLRCRLPSYGQDRISLPDTSNRTP